MLNRGCCGKGRSRGLKAAAVRKVNNVTKKTVNKRRPKSASRSTTTRTMTVGNVTVNSTDTLVNIKYSGRKKLHFVGSPTRGGFYGYHKDGQTFYVLREDQEAMPETFVLVEKAVAAEEVNLNGDK